MVMFKVKGIIHPQIKKTHMTSMILTPVRCVIERNELLYSGSNCWLNLYTLSLDDMTDDIQLSFLLM